MLRFLFVILLLLVGCVLAAGLPGESPPPDLVNQIQPRLRAGQAESLVFIQNVETSAVASFTSGAGRNHYRYNFTVDDAAYSAIFFEGDWTENEIASLETGTATLVGFWDTFQNQPSFVTKLVIPSVLATGEHESEARQLQRPLIRIDDAQTNDIEKFVSRAQRTHVRFSFDVEGYPQGFRGIVYEGDWNSYLLNVLRSGSADMIGYWDEYAGEPFFVLVRLED